MPNPNPNQDPALIDPFLQRPGVLELMEILENGLASRGPLANGAQLLEVEMELRDSPSVQNALEAFPDTERRVVFMRAFQRAHRLVQGTEGLFEDITPEDIIVG